MNIRIIRTMGENEMSMYSVNKYGKKTDYGLLFFLLCFLILIFTVDNMNINDAKIYVYTLNIKKSLAFTGVCMLFTCISIIRKPYIDEVAVILLFSALLGVVPYIYAKNISHYLGNYVPLIISFASYYICRQSKGVPLQAVVNIFYFVCTVVSMEVIATELHYLGKLSITNFANPYAKAFLKLPIGDSNLIAAYLLPLIVFIMTLKPNCFGSVIVAIASLAIVLCRSKNAIALMILIVCCVIAKKFLKWVVRDKPLDKKYLCLFLVLVFIVFSGLFVGATKLIGIIIRDLRFSYSSPYSNQVLNYLDSISSGRLVIFQTELGRFLQHPLLGNGFGYDLGQAKSHNWIIDLLVQRGIIGLLLYGWSIVKVFNKGLKFYKSDIIIRACINLLCIIYIQGLLEVTVFTAGIDFLIWSISGFMTARVKQISCFKTVNES